MLIELEKRKTPSRAMVYLTPLIAVVLTMLVGALVFTLLGFDGPAAVWEIFIAPLVDPGSWQDLGTQGRAAHHDRRRPLRSASAPTSGTSAPRASTSWAASPAPASRSPPGTSTGWWILPLMCIAGALAGMAWAGIPAFLKTRLNVNEILSSLMLTYVAIQILYYLMNGPWKDPDGFNFPQSRLFNDSQILPYFSVLRLPQRAPRARRRPRRLVRDGQDRLRLPGPRRRRGPARRPLRRLQPQPHDLARRC